MVPGTKTRRVVEVCVFICSSIFTTNVAIAQTVTVDAAPSHVANTFSPVRSLGAAIDRLRTGTPEHLLTAPIAHGDSRRWMADRDLSPEHRADGRGLALESRTAPGATRRSRKATS